MTTDLPFEPSSSIKGLTFTGRYHVYTEADTWYPSWASDGRMFSPFTDGTVNGRDVMSFNREGKAPAQIGHAVIHGDGPHALTVSEDGAIPVTIDKDTISGAITPPTSITTASGISAPTA